MRPVPSMPAAAQCPKRKFCPSCTLRTPIASTRIRSTNSRGARCANASSNFSTSAASIPVSASRRSRSSVGVISRGALLGRKNCSGCGSNVTATARAPIASCFARNSGQNLPVSAMHAVKIAHGRDRGTKPCGNLRERAKHLHRASIRARPHVVPAAHSLTGTLNPS